MDAKIRRQVEYYFADYNLMRDTFLKNEIKLSKEGGKDGFVDLDIMLKFNRLAQLTTDKDKILASVASSKYVETNEDKTGIRRDPAHKLPVDDEVYRAGLKDRTCYASEFPKEGTTLDQIFEYLEDKENLNVETVAMRRIHAKDNPEINNKFKGSCFITFRDLVSVSKFLESDIKYDESITLVKMTKKAYWNKHNAENKAKSGKVDANVESAGNGEEKNNAFANIKFQEGIVICYSNVTDKTLKREDFKDYVIQNEGAVDFIDFESGADKGSILLNLEHGKKANEILGEETKKNIKGDEVDVSIGTEEDFNPLLEKYIEFRLKMIQRRNEQSKFKKGKRRGNNRDGKRGRNDRNSEPKNSKKTFADSDDEPSQKSAKVDENPENAAPAENGSAAVSA